MNELQKIMLEKKTENGDKSYRSTGDNLTDLLFMTPYFERNLDEASIGDTEREKVFSMFIRDPRYGLGRRDLGRKLMELSKVSPKNIVKAGRFDDLWHIPTDENLGYLLAVLSGNIDDEYRELAKKWMPRLTGKDKKVAKAFCKMWNISEKEYRQVIKAENTVEYKLSYAEPTTEVTALNDLFNKYIYEHPLVDTIDFEKVPSMAMNKYLNAFYNRDDIKDRFIEYIEKVKENKAKVNVSTSNVMDAYKNVNRSSNEASEVISNKIIENETLGVELNAIVVLDTSGSMTWGSGLGYKPIDKAYSIALALSEKSTYARNQIISFSSNPRLMQIKGNTLREKYNSMYTGDCSNTDFAKVMNLLKGLKSYPEYLVVLSDMEFDAGSYYSKEQTMKIFKEHGANTKIIWWNLNERNKTVPEMDEYGNIYLSGYNLQILRLLENKFDMTTYIDKILEKYKKDIDYKG